MRHKVIAPIVPLPEAERRHLLSMTTPELRAELSRSGPIERAKKLPMQVLRGFHVHGAPSVAELPEVAREKRAWVDVTFRSDRLERLAVHPASDGSARYAFRTHDGHVIETVLLPHHGLYTACVSSQAGCAIGCVFCATGKLGLRRNLEAHEIVDQVLQVQAHAGHRISDLVFMGMGEPLQNAAEVVRACDVLAAPEGTQISRTRMVVSTSGLVPAIRKWTADGHRMPLVFSLVSAIPEKRAELMPIQRVFPFEDFIEAIAEYQRVQERRWVTLEYLALEGKTLGDEDLDAIRQLRKRLRFILNVIPYNPTGTEGLVRPDFVKVKEWAAQLKGADIPVKVRYSFGQEELAGCGQLGATLLKG